MHAQVSGVLQSLLFKEGQQVRTGQVIAQIDPRAFQAAVNQAQGVLARDALCQASCDEVTTKTGAIQPTDQPHLKSSL